MANIITNGVHFRYPFERGGGYDIKNNNILYLLFIFILKSPGRRGGDSHPNTANRIE